MSKSDLNIQRSNQLKTKIPTHFIQNAGQLKDESIFYYAKQPGCRVAFASDGVYFTFLNTSSPNENVEEHLYEEYTNGQPSEVKRFDMSLLFLNARRNTKPEGKNQLAGKLNVFKGNNPNCWYTNIPVFEQVVYPDLWPSIDLVFRSEKEKVKYEFIVHPGANVNDIQFSYQGVDDLSIDKKGNLRLQTPFGEMWDECPITYQKSGPLSLSVACSFQLTQNLLDEPVISFKILEGYDPALPLVIDPSLIFSTYLGGNAEDYGLGIALDPSGNIYVTGATSSMDFPIKNGFQTNFKGYYDAFVTKMDSDGNLIYSSYLGGSEANYGLSIAVDSIGEAYLTGYTTSGDFPVTPDAFQVNKPSAVRRASAFISKVEPTGRLVYSTYFGGSNSDVGQSIAVDRQGNVYFTGVTSSLDYPTENAFQPNYGGGSQDAFIARMILPNILVYSTFLGGSNTDYGNGIAIDNDRNAYVAGYTYSTDFPTKNALQPTSHGNIDATITKVSEFGSLIYSTYLGGSANDTAYSIDVDLAGNAYITGTSASTNFPTTPNSIQPGFNGYSDVIVTKINSTGTALVYSTFLGGRGYDAGFCLTIDDIGNAYITGETGSYDFPTTSDAFQLSYKGGYFDAFVSKVDPTGTQLLYSTYLGGSGQDYGNGIAVDLERNIYVAGHTYSTDFPIKNAFQPNFAGVFDAFVTKIGEIAVAPSPLLEPIAKMEDALANALNAVSASGDVNAIERVLRLIIIKEDQLKFFLNESKNL